MHICVREWFRKSHFCQVLLTYQKNTILIIKLSIVPSNCGIFFLLIVQFRQIVFFPFHLNKILWWLFSCLSDICVRKTCMSRKKNMYVLFQKEKNTIITQYWFWLTSKDFQHLFVCLPVFQNQQNKVIFLLLKVIETIDNFFFLEPLNVANFGIYLLGEKIPSYKFVRIWICLNKFLRE